MMHAFSILPGIIQATYKYIALHIYLQASRQIYPHRQANLRKHKE